MALRLEPKGRAGPGVPPVPRGPPPRPHLTGPLHPEWTLTDMAGNPCSGFPAMCREGIAEDQWAWSPFEYSNTQPTTKYSPTPMPMKKIHQSIARPNIRAAQPMPRPSGHQVHGAKDP